MAAHKLPRFSKSILDKPQLLHPDKFLEIAEVLDNRNEYMKLREEATAANLLSRGMSDDDEDEGVDPLDNLVPYNVGVLDIDGPLTARPNLFQALCGGASYEGLISETEKFARDGKDTILMRISSPGGEAFKMFSSAERIKKICKDNSIKLIAYVDNQAASAGYGLACVADEIISHPESSSIGSVGVIVSMIDNSKQLEQEGLKRVIISAGSNKHPFDEDGSFKDSFLGGIQKDVDKLYAKFITHVASNRSLSEESVRGTEANTYNADEALEIGFIDKLMEEPELYEYLKTSSVEKKQIYQKENLMSTEMKADVVEAEMSLQLSQLKEALAEQSAAMEAQASALASYKAKELADKKASLIAKVSEFGFSNEEAIVSAMMSNNDSEMLLSGLMNEFSAKLSVANKAHEAELSVIKASLVESEKQASLKVEKAQAEATAAKQEFSAPTLIEGDNTSLEDTKAEAKKSSALSQFIKQKHNL